MRLDGPRLERRVDDELPSEGLVRGAIQVPPSGQPLIFLADHPVTGGYPVIARADRAGTPIMPPNSGPATRFASVAGRVGPLE